MTRELELSAFTSRGAGGAADRVQPPFSSELLMPRSLRENPAGWGLGMVRVGEPVEIWGEGCIVCSELRNPGFEGQRLSTYV